MPHRSKPCHAELKPWGKDSTTMQWLLAWFVVLLSLLNVASISAFTMRDRAAQILFSVMSLVLSVFAGMLFRGTLFDGYELAGVWMIKGFIFISIGLAAY